MTLDPTFAPEHKSYTAQTSNNTNTIRATPEIDGADVSITLDNANGSGTVANGTAATWAPGENTLTITVSEGGVPVDVYQVAVTKV